MGEEGRGKKAGTEGRPGLGDGWGKVSKVSDDLVSYTTDDIINM